MAASMACLTVCPGCLLRVPVQGKPWRIVLDAARPCYLHRGLVPYLSLQVSPCESQTFFLVNPTPGDVPYSSCGVQCHCSDTALPFNAARSCLAA